MKKGLKLIVVSMFLASTLSMQAQTQALSSTRAFIPLSDTIEFSLMRTYASGSMFYYVRTKDSNFFALNSLPDTVAQRAYIPLRYRVSDMEVVDEYAYICGHDQQTNKGFVGIFLVEDFLEGNSSCQIYENFQTSSQYRFVQKVKRLCVYGDIEAKFRMRVVAVCTDSTRDYVMEMAGVPGDNAAWTYNVGASSSSGEAFHDVVEAKGYVVTAGSAYKGDGTIALRAYAKFGIFSSPICGKLYPFHSDGNVPTISYALDDYHLTALGNDSVASLSIINTWDLEASSREGVLFNIYDVSDMIGNATPPVSYSARYTSNDTTGEASVTGFRYDATHRQLVGAVQFRSTLSTTGLAESWIPEFNVGSAYTNVLTKNDPMLRYESVSVDPVHGFSFAIGRSVFTPSILVLTTCAYNMQINPYTCNPRCYRQMINNCGFTAKAETRSFNIQNGSVVGQVLNPIQVDRMSIPYHCIKYREVEP